MKIYRFKKHSMVVNRIPPHWTKLNYIFHSLLLHFNQNCWLFLWTVLVLVTLANFIQLMKLVSEWCQLLVVWWSVKYVCQLNAVGKMSACRMSVSHISVRQMPVSQMPACQITIQVVVCWPNVCWPNVCWQICLLAKCLLAKYLLAKCLLAKGLLAKCLLAKCMLAKSHVLNFNLEPCAFCKIWCINRQKKFHNLPIKSYHSEKMCYVMKLQQAQCNKAFWT